VIAVPGKMTSAYLALQLYLDDFKHTVVPFDQIFDAVKRGEADAGLIIHEGQLTYAKSGFKKIVDLGEWWKNKTGLPLPLGGNVIRKDIPENVRHDLSEIMRASIDFGLAHRDEARCDPQISGRRTPRGLHRQSGRNRIRRVSKGDYFFGFSALPTCFRTNVLTRLNSF
jgi:predicted solute-binding protein